MTPERIAAALETCDPAKLEKLANNQNVTRDMLLCELQRVGEILSGRAYFDYDRQVWID